MQRSRWHRHAAVALVLIGSLRIISTYRVFNHTVDEPDNLAAGLEYVSTGRYLYHDLNPPLGRVFAALGPYLAGERYQRRPEANLEGLRILGTGAHYDRVLALARAGILPFFWLAAWVVFRWGLRAGGANAALWGTALFTWMPPVLALSGIANTDMAVAATVPAAALLSLSWAERPLRGLSVGLGILIALAVVSKFTAIPFLAAGWTAMLVCAMVLGPATPRSLAREAWHRRQAIVIAMGTAMVAIWAAYGFSFARVDYLHLRLPAPRFFTGLHAIWQEQHAGHPAYLLGARSRGGFWYYYPVALAIKVPLGFWALVMGSCALLWRPDRRSEMALALAFPAAMILVSLFSHMNVGVRYLLPALTCFPVAAGCAIAAARGRFAMTAAALVLVWCAVSGALQHPDYLAYTNEIAGKHPEQFVADSDLDWGQDMKRLSTFLKSQQADRVAIAPFLDYPTAVETSRLRDDGPTPGWNAVSVTIWKVFGYPTWADRMPEPIRIGRGMLVWQVPEIPHD